jgi:hypothetical protein
MSALGGKRTFRLLGVSALMVCNESLSKEREPAQSSGLFLLGRLVLPAVALISAMTPLPARAIVIRDDVPDALTAFRTIFSHLWRTCRSRGHAVLVSPCWLVTAAHAVTWQKQPIPDITLLGRERPVSRVVVYPGYHRPPSLKRGDSAPLVRFLVQDPDIALVELASPVRRSPGDSLSRA